MKSISKKTDLKFKEGQIHNLYYHLPFRIHKYHFPLANEENINDNQGMTLKIDPGKIPPYYTHTWAIDIRFTEPMEENQPDSFILDFEILNLYLDERGDRLTIVDAGGTVIKRYIEASELFNPFQCVFTEFDEKPFKRIYLILETHGQEIERRMIINGLATTKQPPATAEIRLLEDDIEYDTNNPFVDAWNGYSVNATPMEVYPPWTPRGSQLELPGPPLRSEGWYLIGQNVSNIDCQFFSLLYYNEYTSMLRLYLYNINLTPVASGYYIQIALCGDVDEGGDYLNGAFFPADPDPNKWEKAIHLAPSPWPVNYWTMIETPFLYPMGDKLPLAYKAFPQRAGYYSLYEEQLGVLKKTIRIQIMVIPFLEGTFEGSSEGVAIGEAVQKLGPATIVDAVYSAFKNGKDWYKGASEFSKACSVLEKTASAFSGPLAAAGAVVSIYKTFRPPEKLLRLAIQMKIQEKMTGTINIPLVSSPATEFYLPGKFSILDAFRGAERLQQNKKRYIDSKMPRYDRTLGLFGFGQNPATIELEIQRRDHYPYIPDQFPYYPEFMIPMEYGMPYISIISPVIYNPFANISLTENNVYYRLFFEDRIYRKRISWERGFAETKVDPVISEYGWTFKAPSTLVPCLYKFFQVQTKIRPSKISAYHLIGTGYTQAEYNELYNIAAHATTERNAENWALLSFDGQDPSPLHDIIYYWEASYNIRNRNNQIIGEQKLKLQSPVSFKIIRSLYKQPEYGTNEELVGQNIYNSVKSIIMGP